MKHSILLAVFLFSIFPFTGFAQEYCEVNYTQDIEPITHVVFAGIDNTTNTEINGTPGHEYFPDELGLFDPIAGGTIIIEGNTNGNNTNTFTVFIDWNEDGDFSDEGEMYFAGSIVNSTGNDGQQTITEIFAPDYVDIAETRIRIIKHRTNSQTPVWPTDPCGVYEYGQAEDYPLIVNPVDAPPCEFISMGENENILGDLQTKQIANDFIISSQGEGHVYVTRLEINIFRDISSADLFFYSDNNDTPGDLLASFYDVIPDSKTFVDTVFGVSVYRVVWEFQNPVFVGAEGEKAWFGINTTAENEEEPNYMEAWGDIVDGSVAYFSEDGGNTWQPDPNGIDGAFNIYAICGQMDTEEISEFSFSYYPNPVTDHLKIQSELKVEAIEIFNTKGKKVFQSSTVKNNEINLNFLSTGTYLIRVKLENGRIETFKIIKK